MIGDRERFCHRLFTGYLRRADALVVLAGEDAGPRLTMAETLWKGGGAQAIVLTGGKHQLPRWTGADALHVALLEHGVAPDRIYVDTSSQHTRHQALFLAGLVEQQEWTSLLLVVSAYHAPRAFLTVLKALQEGEMDRAVRLSVIAPECHGSECPQGMATTREDLFAIEMEKIRDYGHHVATFADGLRHLNHWES